MIPFEFEYHKPDTADEAVRKFLDLSSEDKQPLYYGGGTEILSRARLNEIKTGAVVDIKGIPECNRLEHQDGRLIFGAATTLAQVCETNLWPLLSDTSGRVADHTTRCQITLGGNIAGKIKYREAVLPLLLTDSQAVIAGEDGLRIVPFEDVFDQTLQLGKGDFLVQMIVDEGDAGQPYFCVKKTRLDWIDYPLLTVAALEKEGRIRIAFSGLCDFPFRSPQIEDDLNDSHSSMEERVDQAIDHVPFQIADDIHGSAEYRRFVLRNTLVDVLENLKIRG